MRPRRHVWALACGALAAASLVSACVPTARTAGPYEAKAAKTAESVHSSIETDLLLLRAVRRGNTLAAYLSVATSEAEDDGTSAASTFLSIQPPDRRGKDLRSQLSDLLDQAGQALGDARIAGRRGDRGALLATEDDLRAAAQALDDFAQAHQ